MYSGPEEKYKTKNTLIILVQDLWNTVKHFCIFAAHFPEMEEISSSQNEEITINEILRSRRLWRTDNAGDFAARFVFLVFYALRQQLPKHFYIQVPALRKKAEPFWIFLSVYGPLIFSHRLPTAKAASKRGTRHPYLIQPHICTVVDR